MSSAAQVLPFLLDGGESNEQHDRVLDSALAAFVDFGVRRTSVSEIARRSGVSPATLYRWFDGKDDLVRNVILREVRRLLVALEEAVDLTASAEEQFAQGAVILARRLRDDPLINRLKVTEPESILPLLTVDGAGLIELGTAYMMTRIEGLQRDGWLADVDATPFAELVARVIHSLTVAPSDNLPLADDETLRAVARSTAELLLRAGGVETTVASVERPVP